MTSEEMAAIKRARATGGEPAAPRATPGSAPRATAIILPHGGYKKLLTYKKSDLIYRGTVVFCRRFLPEYGDRTVDQMVQAARSGKQNIVEGSEASGTSKETELKLTNVAKASLGELLEDYIDFLKAHGCEEWPKDSAKGAAARRLGREEDYAKWEPYFERKPAEVVANLLVTLIRQCMWLLSRQLAHLEKDFAEHGGVRERMHAARTAARGEEFEKGLYSRLSQAKTKLELDRLAQALRSQIERTAWSISRKRGWQ